MKTLKEDVKSLKKDGLIICDENSDFKNSKHTVIKVSYKNLLKNTNELYKNTCCFGVVVGLLSEFFKITDTLNSHFSKKSKEIKQENIRVAHIGFDFAKDFLKKNKLENFKISKQKKFPKNKNILISGNDASAIGALKAGVKFVAEYPMTPSSSFLSFFASHELDYNITTKHTEDEIAAINMIIGASCSGVRSMTATSGGGFSLMGEAIGFASISENPVVIFECMRAGPSTGIPTYTDQGDLRQVLNASQGDFPVVVLAPGCPEECFYKSFEAFNICDLTQMPVIVLLDKHIGGTLNSVEKFETKNLKINRGNFVPYNLKNQKVKGEFKRYEFTKTGVSKRICLGEKNCEYVSSSYEHDETGWTCEESKNHILMQEKRFRKLKQIPKEILKPKIFGDKKANLTLVGFGSTKTSALEAIKVLKKLKFSVNYFHFIYLNPFDEKYVESFLKSCKNVLILEGNFTAQLRGLIREKTGFFIENTYLKYDGRPFFFEDIVEEAKKYLKVKGGKK